jgi:hypothetical protein
MGFHQHLLLAVTTMDKLKAIPPHFWMWTGIAVAGVIAIFIIVEKVLHVNKFLLSGIVFVSLGMMWFNWIYHRSEPKFLTPVIDRIAPFFPTAGAYDSKQAGTPIKDDSKK